MDLNLAGRHALVCGASEGIGRAAAAMSEMLQDEVLLSVPELHFVTVSEVTDHLGKKSASMYCIRQPFQGMFSGNALLIFPEDKSLEMVKMLIGDVPPGTELLQISRVVANHYYIGFGHCQGYSLILLVGKLRAKGQLGFFRYHKDGGITTSRFNGQMQRSYALKGAVAGINYLVLPVLQAGIKTGQLQVYFIQGLHLCVLLQIIMLVVHMSQRVAAKIGGKTALVQLHPQYGYQRNAGRQCQWRKPAPARLVLLRNLQ